MRLTLKSINKIGLCIIIGFSLFGIIVSVFFLIVKCPEELVDIFVSWIGILGTISSIALSVISMIYSSKSSEKAEDTLQQVVEQYKGFSNKITTDAIERNIGKQSIENMIKKNQANI